MRIPIGTAAVLLVATPLFGQQPPELVSVYGAGEAYLYRVRAGAASGSSIAVLTEPEPAVHLFTAEAAHEWGREGRGPAELTDPVDLSWRGSRVHVLDLGNRKIVQFDRDGGFRKSRSLGPTWANRLEIVGEDTILGTFIPMSGERAVLRLAGDQVDTLLAYELLGEGLRLVAPGAPPLTVTPPFSAQVKWSVTGSGQLVWYDPRRNELRYRSRDGNAEDRTPVTWVGEQVSQADREWWIANEIPADFMGRPVFEPLRQYARDEVEFPNRLAPVLALELDPSNGVWVKRTLSSSGEIWRLTGRSGGSRGELRLPVGRELLAVSATHLFALARDDLGVEFVEVYAKPQWSQ